MSQMSLALRSSLQQAFDAGGWRTVGVQIDSHEERVPVEDGFTIVVHSTATLQVEHVEHQKLLIFLLAGQGGVYSSARLIAGGGSFATDDAALIARLAASIPPALAAMEQALIADLAEAS